MEIDLDHDGVHHEEQADRDGNGHHRRIVDMDGQAVEISDCVDGPPFTVSDCMDLDIVMVDQDGQRLRYGGGNGNRCEIRPTEIDEISYFKVN